MSLAKTLKGDIIAVDLFEEFLEKLKENSAKENTTANIKTLSASMDKLPFEKEELDIIWSEGAVYNIGFKNGINYWKEFLKPGGILAGGGCHGQQTVARKDWKTSGPENMPKWIQ